MVKAKWGSKRTCPKCGTRFYDLGKENPVVCIECDNEWIPEPILKSRQPQLEEEKKPAQPTTQKEEGDEDIILEDEDIEIDEGDDDVPDDDLDLDDGSDVPDVIGKKSPGGEEG